MGQVADFISFLWFKHEVFDLLTTEMDILALLYKKKSGLASNKCYKVLTLLISESAQTAAALCSANNEDLAGASRVSALQLGTQERCSQDASSLTGLK